MNITAKKINKNNFKKFGWVIEWQGPENKKSKNQFRIVVNDAKVTGWRIAYLIVREKRIDRLERHPYSMESFEPVKGKSILYVSTPKKPRDIQAFILDKPIVLKKGIWHGIVAVGRQAHVKITENNTVHMRILELGEWI
ncbi:MAG: ureidoglycolate lyase [Candidatus Omnitrophota bacterium]